MVKIVCKKGDNIYTLSVSTEMIEDFGVVEVYGIRIMGKYQTAEIDDISEDYHYVRRLFDLNCRGRTLSGTSFGCGGRLLVRSISPNHTVWIGNGAVMYCIASLSLKSGW